MGTSGIRLLRAVLTASDATVEFVGRKASWLLFALIIIIVYSVIARYVFAAPPRWSYDMSFMLGATAAAVGLSYVHLFRSHVKVDFIVSKLPQRARLGLELLFTVVFFFPLIVVIFHSSVVVAVQSWISGEVSSLSYWEPPMFPLRAAIAVALFFLALQGTANFIRDLYMFVTGRRL